MIAWGYGCFVNNFALRVALLPVDSQRAATLYGTSDDRSNRISDEENIYSQINTTGTGGRNDYQGSRLVTQRHMGLGSVA